MCENIRKRISVLLASSALDSMNLELVNLYEELIENKDKRITELTDKLATRGNVNWNKKGNIKAPETLQEALEWKLKWKKDENIHMKPINELLPKELSLIKWIANQEKPFDKNQSAACKIVAEQWKNNTQENNLAKYLNLKVTGGKYINKTLNDILNTDPFYINNLLHNKSKVSKEIVEACEELKKEYNIA